MNHSSFNNNLINSFRFFSAMEGEPEFKEAFIERYKQLTDFEAFKACSLTYLRRSIRVNTLKISVAELVARLEDQWQLTPIPWCKEGFWIENLGKSGEKRRDVGNLVEHALGYIYLQEAASMIPPLVLDPQSEEIILDLCAAPGSKTTQIAQYMQNKGLLIANDVNVERIKSLGINTERMGISNCVLTMMDGWKFKGLQFDRVLCDAPCSGTGTIRKSFKTLRIWNPHMVKRLAGIQRQLIATAYENLKPGGILVYSTCTLEPDEDEAVVSHLIEKYPDATVLPIHLSLKRSSCVASFEGRTFHPDVVKHALRIYPQDNDTEGFFVAKIQKGSDGLE